MNHKPFLVALAELIVAYWPRFGLGQRRWLRALLPTPGNILFTLLVVAGLLWATNAGALPLRVPSAAGTSTGTIAYQGRLADSAGNPITNTVNMIFRLYDVPTGGAPLWEEQWTGSNGVRVSDGLFNVMLGSLTQIPQNVMTDHDTLWLGITVGTDDEMEPRVQLGSVPFAVQALTVPDGSITTAKIADGAVTQAKLGSDVSLVPPDGSITTAKIADGAVTSRKLSLTYGQIDIPWASTNSNDWIDIPNSTLVLNADVPSILEVTADLLLTISGTDTAANYAINVNGDRWTNRFLQGGGWNSSVAQYISPVDAGPVTIKLQWRRAYGSGTITLNNVGGMSYLSAKLWSR